jgi:hypothetical protein
MPDITQFDPSMELAWRAANHLGGVPALPAFLQADTARKANARRAVFLMEVENAIEEEIRVTRVTKTDPEVRAGNVNSVHEYLALIDRHVPELAGRLVRNRLLIETTGRLLHDLSDSAVRVNVSLRIYAGYLGAAKIIAAGVRGRSNNSTTRTAEMPSVDARAGGDQIFAAGVRAAPFYKGTVLKEPIFRDGIPAGSIVLEDWPD